MRNYHFLVILICISCNTSSKIASTENDYKKMSVQEAEKLKRAGWDVMPGSISLENSVFESISKTRERDERGNPKYFIADGNAVAQTYTAAQMQSMEVAKIQLATQMQSVVTSIVESNIANNQLSTSESASLTKVIQSSKSVVQAKLGYIQPLFVIIRNIPNSQVEIQSRLAYSYRNALDLYKETLKKELEKNALVNQNKIDELLNFK